MPLDNEGAIFPTLYPWIKKVLWFPHNAHGFRCYNYLGAMIITVHLDIEGAIIPTLYPGFNRRYHSFTVPLLSEPITITTQCCCIKYRGCNAYSTCWPLRDVATIRNARKQNFCLTQQNVTEPITSLLSELLWKNIFVVFMNDVIVIYAHCLFCANHGVHRFAKFPDFSLIIFWFSLTTNVSLMFCCYHKCNFLNEIRIQPCELASTKHYQ